MVIFAVGIAVLALNVPCETARRELIVAHMQTATGWQSLRASGYSAQRMFEARDASAAARAGLDRFVLIDAGGELPGLIIERLLKHPEVIAAESDGAVRACEHIPNDPEFGRQLSLRNSGQMVGGTSGVIGADINAAQAWEISTGSAQVVIAILDTGVSSTHPDLSGKILAGRNFLGSDPGAWEDENGHGTHSAGIAAARSDNGIGVTGVCWNCELVVARVLDAQGVGTWSGVAAAIVWAADQDLVRVILLNLGGTATDAATLAAVNYAAGQGKMLVAAAGNTNGADILFPARFENCIAVSATDHRDRLAGFSAQGSAMDLAAPGTEVLSSFGSRVMGDSYAVLSGTSMAAPHVAGLAGLVWSINPALTAARVRHILESTAKDLGAQGRDVQFGAGRIDGGRAAFVARASLCAADINLDGELDFFDYLDFVALFSVGDRDSDFNADGTIDLFDYLDFTMAFGAGCN